MADAFILCDLLWTVQTSHAGNREGSFKTGVVLPYLSCFWIEEDCFLINGIVTSQEKTGMCCIMLKLLLYKS